ncbi:MAG TPA: thioesterase family protein [Candidatus Acidoferrum sp.]|jgi:acyl-CoA thioester hydrolase
MRTIEYHDTTLRVRYAETDQMGVVYHSNYLIWFEVGRVEFMRAMGYDYKSMETEDDCHIVVVEAHCRYEKPARYDQVLKVRTRVAQWRNRVVKFNYEIFLDENSCLLATGYTTHVVCGRDGRPKSLPTKYRDAPLKLYLTSPDRSNA